jgi:hypothetical protein
MRLTTYHPESSIAEICKRTAFELEIDPNCAPTQPPTQEELELLRNEIDPWHSPLRITQWVVSQAAAGEIICRSGRRILR